MPTTPKVLGQVAVTPNADATLLTVGPGKSAVISTITVCNLGDYATYRIAVRPGGAALEDKHYVVKDAGLGSQTTDTITLGLGVGAGDVVTVRASGPVAFGAYGAEVS